MWDCGASDLNWIFCLCPAPIRVATFNCICFRRNRCTAQRVWLRRTSAGIDQARELAAGHETEFSRRVAAGKVATSKDDGSLGQRNVRIVK